MTNKTDKQFLFDVQLNWLKDSIGICSVNGVSETIQVAPPATFGGDDKYWTPEHLFLSAVSSCFMTTFAYFARKSDFIFGQLECKVIGKIEIVNGKFKFTKIDVYPKVFIENDADRPKADRTLEKTIEYCLITNSIATEVFYHSEILPVELTDKNLSGRPGSFFQ